MSTPPTVRPTIDGLRVRETAPDGKPIGQVYIKDTLTALEPVAAVRAKLGICGAGSARQQQSRPALIRDARLP